MPPVADLTWPLAEHPDPAAAELLVALREAWRGPGRCYHDLRHLGEVLGALDELAAHGVAFDQRAVRLAAWFHDSVYDGERDAEERSALWAEHALRGLVEEATVAEVARLVRLTEAHHAEAGDASGRALCDADLAILAAGPERYADYVAGVRREYSHVGDDDFARGRAAVLEALLALPHLYGSAPAVARWEAPARVNVGVELNVLRERVAAAGR